MFLKNRKDTNAKMISQLKIAIRLVLCVLILLLVFVSTSFLLPALLEIINIKILAC